MLNVRPQDRDLRSPAEIMAALTPKQREKAMEDFNEHEIEALLWDWENFLARPDQREPDGLWDIWMILSGRGWGKTRTGAEWVKKNVDNGTMKRIALVGETAADCRDVMVEGDSGILGVYPDKQRPVYEPTKRRITWQNGAVAHLYNATEPDQLRGPQHDGAWSDELAKWQYARETWDMLQFGLRLGERPRQLVTTTPRPIELVKAINAGEEGKVHVTVGHTLDNSANLAKNFLSKVVKRYQGTRLGRQELSGEILGDIPNAIFVRSAIDAYRVSQIPDDMGRIIVSVDPAVSEGDDANEHGIMVCGLSDDNEHGYLLRDATKSGSPAVWARAALAEYRHWRADGIVVEINQGGDLVKSTLQSIDKDVPILEVRASRGKHIRAEPIASLYEQGRIHHVGAFTELEDQMSLMSHSGYAGEDSPDRVDAMVWAFTELFPELVEGKMLDIPKWEKKRRI